MNIDDIITPESFNSLTKKQRSILNIWYDNNCEGMQFVATESGSSKTNVHRAVHSEIGRKYLEWRAKQDGAGKIDKGKILEELKNIAFANYDDCYEVKENKYYDPESRRNSDKHVYIPVNFSKITKRERRRIKSAIGQECSKYGTKFTMNMKAKMDALEKLSQISELLTPEKPDSRAERSGNSILSRIKKLSNITKKQNDSE